MIALGYDSIESSGDGTRLRVMPNCPEPAGRYQNYTIGQFSLMPGVELERTAVLVRERRPFVYPLELTWDWSRTLTSGPRSMGHGIPSGVLDSIRNGRASLLFFLIESVSPMPDEHSPIWLFDHMQRLVVEQELPPERVWFASSHVRALDGFAIWLNGRGLYEPEAFRLRALQPCASIVRAQYHANAQGWDLEINCDPQDLALTMVKTRFSADDFAARYVRPEELDAERRAGAMRPKRFLAMNRHRWAHRVHVTTYLAGRGYLDDSLVSFPETSPDYYDHFPAPVLDEFLRASWLKLQARLPLIIDEGAPPAGGITPDNFMKLKNGWPYRQSYFNIASETVLTPPPFHTEKVMKAVVNLQPFLVVAAPETLRYLRAIGFKTFGRVFDEDYDLPADLPTRMTRIFQTIDRLGAPTPGQARDLYVECRAELEHNRAHLIEGPHQIERLWAEILAQLP